MYSVTDARTEATNSKCNQRIRRHSYNTVNRRAKFNDNRNMRNCNKVYKPKWLLKVLQMLKGSLSARMIVLQSKVFINYLETVIFCTSHKDVSSLFSLVDCALENQFSTRIGSRSSFSGLYGLNQRPVFADKMVIIYVLYFNQFVVCSMRNPVIYRTAKKVVFC